MSVYLTSIKLEGTRAVIAPPNSCALLNVETMTGVDVKNGNLARLDVSITVPLNQKDNVESTF